MKKNLLLLVVFSLLLSAPAHGMEITEGFLGLPWGSDVSQHKGFVQQYKSGIVEYYVDQDTNYTISDVDSAYVIFGVVQKQLYAAFVGLDTEAGYQRAKDYLLAKFGNAKVKDQGDVQELSWFKDKTVRVKLKKDKKTGEMKMAFYYLPLVRRDVPSLPEGMEGFPSIKWKSNPGLPQAIPVLSF